MTRKKSHLQRVLDIETALRTLVYDEMGGLGARHGTPERELLLAGAHLIRACALLGDERSAQLVAMVDGDQP